MQHVENRGKTPARRERSEPQIDLAKLPARLRHVVLTIGSMASARPLAEAATSTSEIGSQEDWLPVALIPAASSKSGKRCFSVFSGESRGETEVQIDVPTAVALINRGLLCSVPGALSHLTLSTNAVDLLVRGSISTSRVRFVTAAWRSDDMDRKWRRSPGADGVQEAMPAQAG